jgi:hypothetical protein
MTLSHCWGTLPIFTLTEKTRQQLMDGILTSELPKTFADVVFVAHRLGISFLWIDSLCIMQDSLGDWEQEASIMADVYRGSLCNIAATGSSHANEGCLYERQRPIEPCVITTGWEDVPNVEVIIYDPYIFTRIFENDPLRQRAWVVQELLLAPRALHLGKRQMIWECYESTLCEMYPDGAPAFIDHIPRKTPIESMNISQASGGLDYPASSWHNLVDTYTS